MDRRRAGAEIIPAQSSNHNFFREWREFRGKTQAQVERELGWPPSRVSNVELGKAIVTDHVLRALAEAYRCSPGDLLERPPPVVVSVAGPQSQGEDGFAALHDALAALARLTGEAEQLREDVARRTALLEKDLRLVGDSIAEALREGADLAQALSRASASFARAVRDVAQEAPATIPEPPAAQENGQQK